MNAQLNQLFNEIVLQLQPELNTLQIQPNELTDVFYKFVTDIYENQPDVNDFKTFSILLSMRMKDYVGNLNRSSDLLSEKLQAMQQSITEGTVKAPNPIDFTEKTTDEKLTSSSIDDLLKHFYDKSPPTAADAEPHEENLIGLIPKMVVINGSGEKKVNWKKCRKIIVSQMDISGVSNLIHNSNNKVFFRIKGKEDITEVEIPLMGETYNGNALRLLKEIERCLNDTSSTDFKYQLSLINQKCQIALKKVTSTTSGPNIDTVDVPNDKNNPIVEIIWDKNKNLAHILGFDEDIVTVQIDKPVISDRVMSCSLSYPRILFKIPELNDFELLLKLPKQDRFLSNELEHEHDVDALDQEGALYPDIEKLNLNFYLLDGTPYDVGNYNVFTYFVVFCEEATKNFIC